MGKKKNFPHILNASSTLLGLCFVVLTSLKLSDKHSASIIDELTAVAILLFVTSSILSYLSMRRAKFSDRNFEKTADLVFLSGLIFLFLVSILIALKVID